MVIFNSYVKLPEGKHILRLYKWNLNEAHVWSPILQLSLGSTL